MRLTIAYITSRAQPKLEWFLDSLFSQVKATDNIRILVVVPYLISKFEPRHGLDMRFTLAKPNIWQGEYRRTAGQWWANSNARNTSICLCQTDWLACVDDRCVLLPGWLDGIRRAMKHGYAVCGAYEKRHGMQVENGVITREGENSGSDCRKGMPNAAVKCPGEWFFGCNFALPLEWALNVNGFDETCDGLGMEDCIFGMMLQNNGYPICYDQRMKVIQDRTPGQCGPVMRREDRGDSPNDLSHKVLDMLKDRKTALHYWNPRLNLREVRQSVLAGQPFPVPEKREYKHFWDDTPIEKWCV